MALLRPQPPDGHQQGTSGRAHQLAADRGGLIAIRHERIRIDGVRDDRDRSRCERLGVGARHLVTYGHDGIGAPQRRVMGALPHPPALDPHVVKGSHDGNRRQPCGGDSEDVGRTQVGGDDIGFGPAELAGHPNDAAGVREPVTAPGRHIAHLDSLRGERIAHDRALHLAGGTARGGPTRRRARGGQWDEQALGTTEPERIDDGDDVIRRPTLPLDGHGTVAPARTPARAQQQPEAAWITVLGAGRARRPSAPPGPPPPRPADHHSGSASPRSHRPRSEPTAANAKRHEGEGAESDDAHLSEGSDHEAVRAPLHASHIEPQGACVVEVVGWVVADADAKEPVVAELLVADDGLARSTIDSRCLDGSPANAAGATSAAVRSDPPTRRRQGEEEEPEDDDSDDGPPPEPAQGDDEQGGGKGEQAASRYVKNSAAVPVTAAASGARPRCSKRRARSGARSTPPRRPPAPGRRSWDA